MAWERFTEQSLKAFLNAKGWASRLNAPAITPEHLLLGLLDDETAVAVQTLRQWGVDTAQLRAEVENYLALMAPRQPLTEPPAWSPGLQQVVQWAAEEARALREPRIETVHLLLALLRDRDSPAARWLARYGVSWDEARRRLHALKARDGTPSPPPLPSDLVTDLTAPAREGDIQAVSFWRAERSHLKLALLQGKGAVLLGDWVLASLLVEQLAWDLSHEPLPEGLRGRCLLRLDWGQWLGRPDRDAALVDLLNALGEITPPPALVVGPIARWTAIDRLCAAILRGRLCAIAIATAEQWANFAATCPDLAERFCPICVRAPTAREALEWLRAHKHLYERRYRLTVSDAAVVQAVREAAKDAREPLLVAARRLLDAACGWAWLEAAAPPEMRAVQDELALLHAQMQDLLRAGDREHLPALVERALALQRRLDAWQAAPPPSPQVTEGHIAAVARVVRDGKPPSS